MEVGNNLIDLLNGLANDATQLKSRIDKLSWLEKKQGSLVDELTCLEQRSQSLRDAVCEQLRLSASDFDDLSESVVRERVEKAQQRIERTKTSEANRKSINFLVFNLESAKFDHPVPAVNEIGEKLIAESIVICQSAIEQPDLINAICGDGDDTDLLNSWRGLERDARKRLVAEWADSTKSLGDLICMLDDLVVPDSSIVDLVQDDSSPQSPSSLDETASSIKDCDEGESSTEEDSVTEKKHTSKPRSQKRKELRVQLGSKRESLDLSAFGGVRVEYGDDSLTVPEPNATPEPTHSLSSEEVGDVSTSSEVAESFAGCDQSVADAEVGVSGSTEDTPVDSEEPSETIEGTPVLESVRFDSESLERMREMAWRSINDGRFSLAYSILEAGECVGADPVMSRSLASAILLSRVIDGNATEIISRLRDDFSFLRNDLLKDTPQAWAKRLATVSCALRPTLVAPLSTSSSLLDDSLMPSSLPEFAAVCRAIREFGNHQVTVDPIVLAGVRDLADWKKQLSSQVMDLEPWLVGERNSKANYAHGTYVWHTWLKDDQPLGSTIRKVQQLGEKSADTIENFVAQWSDASFIDRRCAETNERRQGKGRRKPIDGITLRSMRQKVQHLIDRLNAIACTIKAKPDGAQNFHSRIVNACRTTVLAHMEGAIRELRDHSTGSKRSIDVTASINVARSNLQAVNELLTQARPSANESRAIFEYLYADLAYVPGLAIPSNLNEGDRYQFHDEDLEAMLIAAENPLSPEDAFSQQTEAKNHVATKHILQQFEFEGASEAIISTLSRTRDEALASDRLQLQQRAESIEEQIDYAVCYDLVNESERHDFLSEVRRIHNAVALEVDLGRLARNLEIVKSELDRLRDVRLDEVRQRLNDLESDLPVERKEDIELVQTTLEAGDFATADEYISLVKSGQSLADVSAKHESIFRDFFSSFLPTFSEHCRQNPNERVVDWAKAIDNHNQYANGLGSESEQHRQQIYKLLEAWRVLLKKNPNDRRAKHIKNLFELIGFGRVETSFVTAKDNWTLDQVSGSQIANARICAIPQFGSNANGRYLVLCVESRASDGDLDRIISDVLRERQGSETPLIVVFRGRLNMQRRRRIAKQSWGKHTYLLFDESVLLYLSTRTENLQQAFFHCCLPFTSAQPYKTTASLVPIEMFFGRQLELNAIISREGTNLVYGGRQLGKSVLLREVERRQHAPENGIVVRWIDLKNRRVGTQLAASELWGVIAEVLQEEGVLDRAMSNNSTIRKRVKEWLAAANERRILLLLDEADAFLEQDSQEIDETSRLGFPVVSELKGLMDETERRFKVVFAGLHNVQRAAKDSNTPIAHLGDPVNIGPLLDKGEWKEAKALIEKPMAQLGFVFADKKLVIRILSYTNYYPSLIQIFCKHLLQSLHKTDRSSIDFRNSPPYVISLDDIERVYQSSELQREIRDRFEWTLRLDQRYRLIALLIALRTIEMREFGDPIKGVELRAIRDLALDFWSEGFEQDSSFDGFEILLDEMVGLGVLRRDPEGRYELRSANVLNLLGSKERIEERLCDVAESPPPSEYKASTFRPSLGTGFIRRSPLTAQQQGRILARSNSTTLLSGCNLALLKHVTSAIETLGKSDLLVQTYDGSQDAAKFIQWLDTVRGDAEGLTIAMVPPNLGWDDSWVNQSIHYLARKKAATKRFIRVVFIADPPKLWNLEIGDEINSKLDWIQLHPWSEAFLERWMEDNTFNRDVQSVKQLREGSGGWGYLIQELAESCEDHHLWTDKLAELLETWPQKAIDHDLLQLPVLPHELFVQWVGLDAENPISRSFLKELMPEAEIDRFLDWAERLFYVEARDGDTWCINPLISKSLQEVAST